MQERNEIIFRGNVVSMNVASKISTFRMVIEINGNKNFPLVYVHNNQLLNGINIRDRVYVKGHTQNHLVYHRSTERSSSQTIFVADEIYRSGRLLCDYFPSECLDGDIFSGGAPEDIDRVIICGKVIGFYVQNDEYIRVKVLSNINDQSRQCDLTCAHRQSKYARKHLKEGDYIAATGYAYTNIRTMPDNKKIYYESIFCDDICKVK